jgi:hypothetical protein
MVSVRARSMYIIRYTHAGTASLFWISRASDFGSAEESIFLNASRMIMHDASPLLDATRATALDHHNRSLGLSDDGATRDDVSARASPCDRGSHVPREPLGARRSEWRPRSSIQPVSALGLPPVSAGPHSGTFLRLDEAKQRAGR